MTRVLIVGGPGSGKTTLGQNLAATMNANLYMLDSVGWENGAGAERSSEARQIDVLVIASQINWIAEGAFIGWTDPIAEAAETILWLDVPWRIARWRIVSRHFKASIRLSNQHPGLLKLWRFLRFSREFYLSPTHPDGRTDMKKWLSSFESKVIVCKTNGDVEAAISSVFQQKSPQQNT